MTKKYRAAVIGVGYLGNFHVQKYLALDSVELVALVETDFARRAEMEVKHGVKSYSDFRDILADVDLVSIVVPPRFHYPIAAACIEHGVHVLVEKPVTETVTEAEKLIVAADSHGVVFQVGHLERFNPAVLALREHVRQPKNISAERLAPYKARGTEVNVVLDLMIHDIDIVLSLVDSTIVSVEASGGSVVTGDIDFAQATLTFDNGCVAHLAASRASQDLVRSMTIQEKSTYVAVDYLNHEMVIGNVDIAGNKSERKEDTFVTKTAAGQDILMAEIQSFVEAIDRGREPTVTGEDGKRALEIAIDVSRAIYASKTVDAPQQWPVEFSAKLND